MKVEYRDSFRNDRQLRAMEISTQEEYDRQQQRLKKEEMEQLKLKVLQERSEYATAEILFIRVSLEY
jgi:hypothetical protein